MGMVVWQMTNNRVSEIRTLLINEVLAIGRIKIEKELVDSTAIQLIFIPDFLSARITGDEITVFYAHEHDEFFQETFHSELEWVKTVGSFIRELATNTVRIEYYYHKKTLKLLGYKIWIDHEKRKSVLLKRVLINAKPLMLLGTKLIVSQTLNNKKEDDTVS